MRLLILSTVLIAFTTASGQTVAPPDRAALVQELVTLIERGLDRETLMRTAASGVEQMAANAATQTGGEGADPNAQRALQSELTARALSVFRTYFESPNFVRSTIQPWVEANFTTSELDQIVKFARTDAGGKFVARMPRLQRDVVARAQSDLEPELTRALFGERAQEILRGAAIRRTAADMRTIATALEAYATDHPRLPAASSISDLKPFLSPVYIKSLPEKDAWGRPFEYIVGSDGRHYRIISGGADGIVDATHRQIAATTEAKEIVAAAADDATGDLVYQDGSFRVVPPLLMPMARSMRSSRSASSVSSRPTPPGFERVGGDVRAPIVISRVEPVFPAEARAARVSGIVIVEVLIDAAGNVVDAIVLKPLPFGLDQAAVDAVKRWKFEPALKNGVPVPVVFNLTINFKLQEPEPGP